MTVANLAPAPFPAPTPSSRDVLDALPVHLATLDTRGVVIEANRAWSDFGFPAAGVPLFSAWDGNAVEALARSTLQLGVSEVLAGTRDRFEIEYPLRRANGTLWFALAAYGHEGGAVVSQSDVTARRHADARRAQENAAARIDRALAHAGQELITSLDLRETLDRLGRLTMELLDCDSSHTILSCEEDEFYTAAACSGETTEDTEAILSMRLPQTAFVGGVARGDHLEVSQVDFREQPLAPLQALAKRLRIQRLLQISLRIGDRRVGFQTACRRRDQPFSDVEKRLAARLGQLAALAIENARLVDQLGEASRLKSEFVATVSHELRTPIHVVLGFTDLVLDGQFGELSDGLRDAMSRILFGARSLLELSEATLQLTRLDDGRVPIERSNVALPDVFAEAEAEVRETQREVTVPIELRIAAGLETVRTDRAKLKLILKNLLSNGLKFTAHGKVSVALSRSNDDLEIVVEDTGVGIHEDAIPTIFDAFRQADGSAARRHGGVGLGLHIVRRTVERLGGTIRAESPGASGARFEVTLPIGGTLE